jgi:hypothetical protein
MANANKPMGLAPAQYLNGAPWNGQARIYSIAPNYNTALYIGDPVMSSGTADAAGNQGIALYNGTSAIRGVIVGIGRGETLMANPASLDRTYFPANGDGTSTPWYAMVVDDPNVLFEVQENANGTALSPADIGLNTTLKSGTGNGYTSGWQLSSYTDATPATTATLPVRLMGLVRRSDNAFGPYAKHLVKINNHELGNLAAGV